MPLRGLYLLKAVLPTVLKADPYARFEAVRGGTGAQLAYLEAIDPAMSAARRSALAEQLRAYCRVDSWAMIAVARFLEGRPLPAVP